MRGLALVVVAACSYHDPGGIPGDGGGIDGNGDGPVGGDGPLAACNYTEAADGSNNTSGGAEATSLTFATPTVLCGALDTGHFDGASSNVDIDAYKLTVAADTDVLMHITAPGAEALDRVAIQILSTGGTQLAFGTFTGDHGTLRAHLPAGDYLAGVSAFHTAAIAAALPYRVKIVGDTPDQRCVKNSIVARSFAEAGDGAGTGNDMISIDESSNTPRKPTVNPADVPEAAGSSAPTLRVSGSAALLTAVDSYTDRDTYEFTTGASNNQLTIRLDWASTAVDFDYFVFEKNTVRSIGSGLESSDAEDEFDTFSVKPNTAYWLWIGAFAGAALPANYEATLCNETFTP